MWRFWLLCSAGWAQAIEPLSHGLALSPFLHSYGWGVGLYVSAWRGSKWGSFWMGDLTSYRSKYEGRVRSAYRDQGGKDYVFGKLYYAYLLQLVRGYQYIIAPRTITSPLQVSLQGGLGLSVGILKPYYLEIAVPVSSTQAVIEVDTYDPLRHSYTDIVGEADFYLGFDRIQMIPGFVVQAGVMMDVGKDPSLIRGLAVGMRIQGFARPLQTLYQRAGRSLWAAGYMAFYIGNAWK